MSDYTPAFTNAAGTTKDTNNDTISAAELGTEFDAIQAAVNSKADELNAVLTTPNIGVPSAGTLTNCTGLPISTGVSGLGTGVATFLATPSSANLASAVTGETGSGSLVFGTSPTIADPTISGTINATGGQIAFPASQNASADANTLDDYEEGTWTPSLGGTTTYTLQSGTYTKIGRVVHVSGIIQVNAIGTGSTTVISGLPFTSASTSIFGGCIGNLAGTATSIVSAIFGIDASSTSATIRSLTAAGSTYGTNAIFTAGTRIDFCATYNV